MKVIKYFLFVLLSVAAVYLFIISSNFHTAPTEFNYQKWINEETDSSNYTQKIKIINDHRYVITQDTVSGITVDITRLD